MSRLIPVLTVVALVLPAGSARASSCPDADRQPTADTLVPAVLATICLVNEQRAAAGVEPVEIDMGLTAVAFGYAREMVGERFYGHVSPDGRILADRLAVIGYDPYAAGENIYWGMSDLDTPAEAVTGWLQSPEHRKNMLEPLYRRVGIGIATGTPMGFAGPAATYVADFDSGPHDAQPDGPSAPTTDVIDAGAAPAPVYRAASRVRRVATRVRRAVRMWVDANHAGDADSFCRLEDNRMLGAQFGLGGPPGISACRHRFTVTAGAPRSAEVTFAGLHVRGTSARVTVLVRGVRGVIGLRKFNGHWKIDAVGG